MPDEAMTRGGASARILVVGDVIDDVVVVPHGPIRPNTDTVSDIRFTPGGSASNTASWLGHTGTAVDFVGMVGQKDVARHAAEFASYGVRAQLQSHPSLPTGAIVIIVDGDSRTMLTERGANDAIDLGNIDLVGFSLLHLTGYSLFTRPDIDSVSALITRAREAGLEVCVDPASAGFLADFGVERFLDAIAGATILVPNLDEARVLTGLDDVFEAAAALRQRFDVVAVTRDRSGAVVAGPELAPTAIAAVPATIVDPTGAGDAFTAGFLRALLDHAPGARDVASATTAGAALAATAVAAMGARPPL